VQAGLAAELQAGFESFAWGGATKTLKWRDYLPEMLSGIELPAGPGTTRPT